MPAAGTQDSPPRGRGSTASKARSTHIPTDEKGGKRKASGNLYVESTYDIGGKLGTGAFGVVLSATHKIDGSAAAVKVINKDRSSKDMTPEAFAAEMELVRNEIKVLENIAQGDCNAIIGFKGAFETQDKLYIVMERAHAELAKVVEAKNCLVSEREAQIVVKRVLQGVAFMHERDYVHRDLKFENLLIMQPGDFGSVVITDFGLATKTNEAASGECGTALYMAPEIWTRKSIAHGPKVDIWAVGIITYILLCGNHPIRAHSVEDLKAKVCVDRLDLAFNDGVTEQAQDFIRRLLTSDPISRPAAKDALEHPWLTGESTTVVHESVVEMMRAYVAELRLKSGFYTVQATTRVRKLSELSQLARKGDVRDDKTNAQERGDHAKGS